MNVIIIRYILFQIETCVVISYVSCIINEFSTERLHNGLETVVLPTIILVRTSEHMLKHNRVLNFVLLKKITYCWIRSVRQFQI